MNKKDVKKRIYLILWIAFIVSVNILDVFLINRTVISHLTYLQGWDIILINGIFNKRTNLTIRIAISLVGLTFVAIGIYFFN